MSALDSNRFGNGGSADYRAALLPNRIYRVRLCSGEYRNWRLLGNDRLFGYYWQDCVSGERFTERSLSYAWEIVEVSGGNTEDEGVQQKRMPSQPED